MLQRTTLLCGYLGYVLTSIPIIKTTLCHYLHDDLVFLAILY
jgi:hypothetical protein